MGDSQIIEPDIDSFIEKFLCCPTTGKIFNIPVIDKNGQIHELSTCQDNDVYTFFGLKSFIGSLIDKYPELKIRQFNPDKDYKKQHMTNKHEIINLIKNGKYINLKSYTSFSLKLIPESSLISLIQNADIPTLEHVIDNTIDLSIKLENCYLINHICKEREELIKYVIEKGNQMNLRNGELEWYPLHQILYNCTDESLFKYAIDKHIEEGLDLYVTNNEGNSILTNIFKKSCGIIK